MRVACLGPEGTFSEDRVVTRWPEAEVLLCDGPHGIEAIFENVMRGAADVGVVPFCNLISGRSAGVFRRVYRSLLTSRLSVAEVLSHPIDWCAISRRPLGEARTLHTFSEGEKQCARWLSEQEAQWRIEPADSTAAAARAASLDPTSAALSSERAAARYGVPIREARVQDSPENRTWFYAIERKHHAVHGPDCCTLIATWEGAPISTALGAAIRPKQFSLRVRDRWLVRPFDETGRRSLEFFDVPYPCDGKMARDFLHLLGQLRGGARIVGCYPAYDLELLVCGSKCDKP